MRYILIFFSVLLLQACIGKKADKTEKHSYQASEDRYCTYETKNGKMHGPRILYDEKGSIVLKQIYINDSIQQSYHYENGVLVTLINYEDSSNTQFFDNGKIMEHNKYAYDGIYYSNEYDSLTGELTHVYRKIDEYIKGTDDSIIIEPYAKIQDRLENYSYIIVLYDKKDLVTKTYYQKGSHPRYALKKEKTLMKWTKVICDSIGCYSIPVTYHEE